jgi:hypothetical protein
VRLVRLVTRERPGRMSRTAGAGQRVTRAGARELALADTRERRQAGGKRTRQDEQHAAHTRAGASCKQDESAGPGGRLVRTAGAVRGSWPWRGKLDGKKSARLARPRLAGRASKVGTA